WEGDHSSDIVIKVGAYDGSATSTTSHATTSFMMFPELGIDGSHSHIIAAELDLFDTWASICTPERFDVAPVTEPWQPSPVTSDPGPAMGASIGNLTPNVPDACHNTGADRSVGDQLQVPLSVDTFNGWANGTVPDYGLGMLANVSDTLHWKQF